LDTTARESHCSHPNLCEFSSGLATIYPETTRVESYFVGDWERDEFRSALMNFSLEGIVETLLARQQDLVPIQDGFDSDKDGWTTVVSKRVKRYKK
jgi:hypothetical protein